jgi:ribonuclease P protein component
MREADLPAEQPEAQEEARIPVPDAYARRPLRAEVATQPWARAPLGLSFRIRHRATFALLARARVFRCDPIWVRRVPVMDAGPEVGFTVSRRVGNAVTRNRVRRRLRAAFREAGPAVRADSAYLVGATPAAARASFDDLRRALGDCLRAAA